MGVKGSKRSKKSRCFKQEGVVKTLHSDN